MLSVIRRSTGFIMKDSEQQEAITPATILLFGKDSTILSVLPRHKTDAVLRAENLDRCGDRYVIITNLPESYDRLIALCIIDLDGLHIKTGTL